MVKPLCSSKSLTKSEARDHARRSSAGDDPKRRCKPCTRTDEDSRRLYCPGGTPARTPGARETRSFQCQCSTSSVVSVEIGSRRKLAATTNHLQIGLIRVAHDLQFHAELPCYLALPFNRRHWAYLLESRVGHNAIGRNMREQGPEITQHPGAVFAITDV
jgi:hypothetical protein